MLKALVFDFDGVIVNTEVAWYDIYKDWLKEQYGFHLQVSDYVSCVGANTTHLISFLQEHVDKDIDIASFEENAIHEFIERTKDLPLMEGVKDLIVEAKKKGLYIALATSATRKKPVVHLTRLGLLDYFDVLSTAELSKHIKPEPDIFLKAAQLLDVRPEECLAIEDSENGLLSAIRANMPCLIVPNEITRCNDFHGCYKKLDSLSSLCLDDVIKDFK